MFAVPGTIVSLATQARACASWGRIVTLRTRGSQTTPTGGGMRTGRLSVSLVGMDGYDHWQGR